MKLRGVPLLCLLAACAAPVPRVTGDAPIRIELIAFNDFHGHLDPPGTPTRVPGAAGEPDVQLSTGGVAWLAGEVEALRRAHPASVVVAAGDLIGGSPLTSSLLKHEPSIDALSAAGLEFTSVGNHEFDRGAAELQRLARRAGFQYLAANVRVKATGKLLFPAWARKRVAVPGRGAIDIAFVGAVLHTTPELVGRGATAGLEFLDEAESVNRAVAEVHAAGIETIVLLIHEGGFTSSTRFDDADCPDFRGPILDIVDRLDPAIDVVVSGHTHRTYICRRNGRLVTSAGVEGRFITDIALTIDPLTHDVREASAHQLPVINDALPNPLAAQYPAVRPDAALLARVAQWNATVATQAQRPLGSITAPLTRVPDANGETRLGDVVADAELRATAPPDKGGAQLAFVNNGGLRADLAATDGKVSYANAFGVHPFGNIMVTMTLTGAEIDTALETQWQGAGSLLQVSNGLTYRWRASAAPGAKIMPGDILLNGVPLAPEATYRVTVSDFLGGGGDGYLVFKQGRERVPGPSDLEVLQQYLAAHSPLPPPEAGRIVRLP
ncbi:MAG: bifunctional metallophosphatase/5'-nucleotidase [Pseudomonadota bacterium]